jgi:hypothetical protein
MLGKRCGLSVFLKVLYRGVPTGQNPMIADICAADLPQYQIDLLAQFDVKAYLVVLLGARERVVEAACIGRPIAAPDSGRPVWKSIYCLLWYCQYSWRSRSSKQNFISEFCEAARSQN